MRTLLFLPLAYIAGVDGFMLFVPVLLGTLALDHVLHARAVRLRGVSGSLDSVLEPYLAGNQGELVAEERA